MLHVFDCDNATLMNIIIRSFGEIKGVHKREHKRVKQEEKEEK